MALLIEDGTGKADAESYASGAQALAFWTARGIALDGLDTPQAWEPLLLRAMDALEERDWRGWKVHHRQALAFPRSGITDRDHHDVPDDSVPQPVLHALFYLARHIAEDADPSARVEPAVRREKASVVDTEYAVRAGQRARVSLSDLPAVLARLRPYLAPRRLERA